MGIKKSEYILWGSDDELNWCILEYAEDIKNFNMDYPYTYLFITGGMVVDELILWDKIKEEL